MQNTLSVLMAQINPMVGAIEQNTQSIIDVILTHQQSHDVIVFPELTITGYSPEDLLCRDELFKRVHHALQAIINITQDCHVIVGHPSFEQNNYYNSASILFNNERIALYHKQHLPNYGVFDELRYFSKGIQTCLFTIKGFKASVCICEDMWHQGPVEQVVAAGADILFSLNASPFDETKSAQRESLLRQHAQAGLAIVYVNQVGGQDDIVFDGQSMAFDSTGMLCARSKAFETQLQTLTLIEQSTSLLIHGHITPQLSHDALIYQALVCGLRDYVEKNKFPGVLLGLSGGIDSALTLALAVDALGASRVHAVMLPSRYTANISSEDALSQLNTQQVPHSTLSIEPAFETLLTTLRPAFNNKTPDITEENMQARIRGLLLMALSNKTGYMLLTTSNKSEAAVGYSTLYGDMCGGFSPLKDVLKTRVYDLARYRNRISAIIPERVIERAPTAELAPNQLDQDSLPDYGTLDAILYAYINERLEANEIIARGYNPDDVRHIIRLIKRNEYKRRQSAPGIKISTCSFDRDWRYPITSGF